MTLNRLRPAALTPLQIAHRVRNRRHEERRPRERMVESRQVKAKTAALRRSLVPEARTIHIRTRRKPIDRAIDAEQHRIEEILLAALGEPRHAIIPGPVLAQTGLVHVVVSGRKAERFPIPMRSPRIDGEENPYAVGRTAHLICPVAEARRRDLQFDGIGRLRLVRRHAHVAVDAAPERGKRNTIVVEALCAALRHSCHLRVERHLLRQLRAGIRPERIEVLRRRRPLRDLRGIVADAPDLRRAFAGQRQPQEPRLGKSSLHRERVPLGQIDAPVQLHGRPEIVKLHLDSACGERFSAPHHCHGECRLLAHGVEEIRVVVCNRKLHVDGKRSRSRETPNQTKQFSIHKIVH